MDRLCDQGSVSIFDAGLIVVIVVRIIICSDGRHVLGKLVSGAINGLVHESGGCGEGDTRTTCLLSIRRRGTVSGFLRLQLLYVRLNLLMCPRWLRGHDPAAVMLRRWNGVVWTGSDGRQDDGGEYDDGHHCRGCARLGTISSRRVPDRMDCHSERTSHPFTKIIQSHYWYARHRNSNQVVYRLRLELSATH